MHDAVDDGINISLAVEAILDAHAVTLPELSLVDPLSWASPVLADLRQRARARGRVSAAVLILGFTHALPLLHHTTQGALPQLTLLTPPLDSAAAALVLAISPHHLAVCTAPSSRALTLATSPAVVSGRSAP